MKPALAAPAITALKAWALAEVVMASVYFGQWRALRFENPQGPAPQSPLVAGLEIACLIPFAAAIILTWRWWQGTRVPPDRRTSWGALLYSLATILSFALWDSAQTLGQIRPLYALDAAIALLGLWPALSLVALIRHTQAQP